MDNIFIYEVKEFYKLLGLRTWEEVETQLEKDMPRIKYNLDGTIINNIKDLWKKYGPLSKNMLKCLTQNVFFPGLYLLYDNYETQFIQHSKYHHFINKKNNVITTTTTQQSFIIDKYTNDIILGESILITTTISPPIATIEFKTL
jgi:hypothetical protein